MRLHVSFGVEVVLREGKGVRISVPWLMGSIWKAVLATGVDGLGYPQAAAVWRYWEARGEDGFLMRREV